VTKSPNRSIFVLALILAILFTVGLAPSLLTDREVMKSGYTPGLSPPSRDFPLGTDQLGRDVFVWVVHGTRIALYVGMACTAICFAIALLDMFAGYFGGKVDQILMRITDLTMSIPRFVLIVVFATLMGSSFINIILIIGTLSWPTLARIMRAETLSLKEREFVLSARVVGSGPLNVIFTEIFPNVLPAVIPAMALQFSLSIIDEIAISFLGLGDPNVASWGRLISVGKQAIFAGGWWVLLCPILVCIFMLVCLNLLADRLNDRFNPRLRYGSK
jgi:peptide/nickel transport system permease protein